MILRIDCVSKSALLSKKEVFSKCAIPLFIYYYYSIITLYREREVELKKLSTASARVGFYF
jgi:hypothetical protein